LRSIEIAIASRIGAAAPDGSGSCVCRRRHLSPRTEEAYRFWIRQSIFFHGKRHPRELREAEVAQFVNHLAVQRKVAASTQTQALNALAFLYRAKDPCVGGSIPPLATNNNKGLR
jgi:hypothetical protein